MTYNVRNKSLNIIFQKRMRHCRLLTITKMNICDAREISQSILLKKNETLPALVTKMNICNIYGVRNKPTTLFLKKE